MKLTELKRMLASDLEEARQLLHLEEEVQHYARQDLAVFCRLFWDEVEPGRAFLWNWHLDQICEHLMAVSLGVIKKLMISVPPRTTKSTITSVMWQPWTWAQLPEEDSDLLGPRSRWLTGSHSEFLSVRDTRRSRRIMESAAYSAFRSFGFLTDTATQFENTSTGKRMAFGTLTGITGEGGDYLSLDDPHPAIEGMFSKAGREHVLNTWDMQMANRVSDPIKSARIITMQRLHVSDLVGHILSKEHDWTYLKLPMEAPDTPCVTVLGLADPRKPGELLWPKRFPESVVEAEKTRLGTYGSAAQLDQTPIPMGGTIIPLDKIFRVSALPKFRMAFLSVDTSQKDREINDPWAIGLFGITVDGRIILADVFSKRMTYPAGKRAVLDFWKKWRDTVPLTAAVIEDKSSGSSLIQELRKLSDPIPAIAISPTTDKVTRMSTESPVIDAGLFGVLDDQPWLIDYLAELGGFPDYPTKDRVDMTSMALLYARKMARDTVEPDAFEGFSEQSSFIGVGDYVPGTDQGF